MKKTDLVGDRLRQYGFVHVTGLFTSRHGESKWTIVLEPAVWGRTRIRDSMQVAVMTNGEIWLRALPHGFGDDAELAPLLGGLCPNKGFVYVPCAGGEGIPHWALMPRITDPTWTDGGHYPIPSLMPAL